MNTKRRTFLKRAGLAGISFLAAGLSVPHAKADPDPPAGAKPPVSLSNSPDPEIFSFTIGGTEAHVIHDGSIGLPSIQPAFAPEAKKSEIDELQGRNFLPVDRLALSMNVLVVKTGAGIVLFDSGTGVAFGPVGGRLVRGLARLGITPGDVKTIFITHGHIDHIGGLVDAANKPVFTSAKLVAAKREVDFWTGEAPDLSGMRTPADETAKMAATVKGFFGAVKSNLDLRLPGRISDEVDLVDAPGHTPGHSMFQLTLGGEKLLVIGDAVHVYSLQFPHPEWTMIYDSNPSQAVTTRRKMFKAAAKDRTLLLGYHMPFPGLGHARVMGAGYEWVPRPWVA